MIIQFKIGGINGIFVSKDLIMGKRFLNQISTHLSYTL